MREPHVFNYLKLM
jgi:hypothetical protein